MSSTKAASAFHAGTGHPVPAFFCAGLALQAGNKCSSISGMSATPPPVAKPLGSGATLVLLHGDADPQASLAALGHSGCRPLITVLWPPNASPAVEKAGRALGERLFREGALSAFVWQPLTTGDWRRDANAVLAAMTRDGGSALPEFVLLLSSSVIPEDGCLRAMTGRLVAEPDIAGVCPLLLAPAQDGAPRRVRHLGSVFDSRRQIHALYEGIAATHPLAQRRRRFQVALEDALMVRRSEICAAGGFSPQLDDLAPLDLCFRLGGGRAAFSTEPEALATLADIHAGWRSAACWNSLVQRGRIPPDTAHPDYHLHVRADGLTYGLGPWLEEGPRGVEIAPQGGSWTDAWLRWRHAPEPANLLRLLAGSDAGELSRLVDHCRSFPCMLPHMFAWYAAQARHIEDFARSGQLPELEAEAARWRRSRARFHHRMLRPGMRALADAGLWACSLDAASSSYDAWMELREPVLPVSRVEAGREWPEIAVLMPVWNPRPAHLAAALDSVLAQGYDRWQLCVADDASPDPEIPELLRAYAARDARIRLTIREKNGHISRATNSALALTDAPWAAFFDHDDLLAPTALEETAAVIAGRPDVRLIYTDEDKIDADGVRRTPVFKPDFDFDLHSVGHLATYATDLVRAVGGLRPGIEGSQDFDLSLRVTERLDPRAVAHIPRVLYHWRVHEGSTSGSLSAKPYVLEATQRALMESARRRGLAVEGAVSDRNNYFRLVLEAPPRLRCSVILLADAGCAGRPAPPALMKALRALAARMPVEFCWQPLAPEASRPWAWASDILPMPRLLPPAGQHWSDACRAAARLAQGDVLFFLHAGLTPVLDCRPEQLVIQAARRDLAMVGGLVWKGGALWNGGFAPDVTGLPFPLLRGATPEDLQTHCWGQFLLARHTLGVAHQCMVCRRELFLDGMGPDARMGSLAGVDYTLRQESAGRFTLVSPWGQWELPADAKHELLTPEAEARFRAQWGETVQGHGLRNPHLRAAPDYGWRIILDGSAERAS